MVYVLTGLMAASTNQAQGMSEDTKTIVTVLLLVFFYPVGVIVMWFWTHWPTWAKIIISSIIILPILGILAAIILVAVNPARQLEQANNTQRRTDVTAILNAVKQYAVVNKGQLPPGSPIAEGLPKDISSANTGVAFCNALVPAYFEKLPVDPKTGSYTDCNAYETKYSITVNSISGDMPRITIFAPDAGLKSVISVTR